MTPKPHARRLARVPISVRLGAAFAAVLLLVLSGLAILAYWGVGQTIRAEIDRSLVAAAGELNDRGVDADAIDNREFAGVESTDLETQVVDSSGDVVGATTDDLRFISLLSRERVRTAFQDDAIFLDVIVDGERSRALVVPLRNTEGQVLAVVAELDSVEEAQAALLGMAGPLSLGGCLFAGVTGWFVARRGLAPIAAMTNEAEGIGAGDLSRRLPVPASRDEVSRLGRTLNGMLARIDDAHRRQRNFTADASHELRTPLAILRTELELAAGRTSEPHTAESLASAMEEGDRLGQLVDDLLLLARADAGRMPRRTLLDVSQVTDTLLPRFRVLAERRGIALTRHGDAVLRADAAGLSRALSNLLDNAIRHAPPNGNVELTVATIDKEVLIAVTDDGPGVPAGDRNRIMQRFAQIDDARGNTGGAGLGLAIVSAVAAAHHGTVEINEPATGRGLTVTLRLPKADTEALISQDHPRGAGHPRNLEA